jgi:hypothetical protein
VLCALVADVPMPPLSEAPVVLAVHQCLSELVAAARSREELASAFSRSVYSRWAALLLGPVLRDWVAAFTSAQRGALFEAHFLRAPPRAALEAIATALSGDGAAMDATSPHQRATCCAALLGEMVKRNRFTSLFADACSENAPPDGQPAAYGAAYGPADAADAEALVSLLVALPARFANALRGAPPRSIAPARFYEALCEQLLAAVALAKPPAVALLLSFGGVLLARIARVGQAAAFLPPLLAAHRRERSGCASCPARLMTEILPGALEPVLEAALRFLTSGASRATASEGRSLLGPTLRKQPAARRLLSERFLLTCVSGSQPVHAFSAC